MRATDGPAVLLVGGLFTSPIWYRHLRGALLARGAARFSVAPVWFWHWLHAGFVGAERSASVVAEAVERLHAADGRPILLIGHSGGGILARLALSSRPFGRARRARPGSVGALVTLGTPHLATRFGGTIGRHGLRAIRFLQAQDGAPSSAASPWLMTVGGRLGDDDGHRSRLRSVVSTLSYRALLGPAGTAAAGDGLCPLSCALAPDGERLALHGIAHAPFLGAPWYLSSRALDGWWDRAVSLWGRSVDPLTTHARGAGA
jgi:pimeloyl-ACP methyl ester carboxylesterase